MIPGTAAGTVRLKAVTVALAICSGVACSEHSFPGVTMFGFNNVPKYQMKLLIEERNFTFKIDMVVGKGLVYSGQNFFGDHLADFKSMISIDQDFWFDNWNKTVHLAD